MDSIPKALGYFKQASMAIASLSCEKHAAVALRLSALFSANAWSTWKNLRTSLLRDGADLSSCARPKDDGIVVSAGTFMPRTKVG